jgi:hypothetical protein
VDRLYAVDLGISMKVTGEERRQPVKVGNLSERKARLKMAQQLRRQGTPTAAKDREIVVRIRWKGFSLTVGRASVLVLAIIVLGRIDWNSHVDMASLLGASAGALRLLRKLWKS